MHKCEGENAFEIVAKLQQSLRIFPKIMNLKCLTLENNKTFNVRIRYEFMQGNSE